MDLPKCDFDDPEAVVASFVRAMNAWELEAAGLPKEDRADSWAEVRQKMDSVFAEFCTSEDRPYGRQGAFQSPPEYDPAREEVFRVTLESPKKAFVDTQRRAVLGGGEYRYVLHLCAGRWLIDNLKFKESDGSFSKAIL